VSLRIKASTNNERLGETFLPTRPHPQVCSVGELHLWYADSTSWADEAERFMPWLSESERHRHARFRRSEDRLLYAVSHAALRFVIAGYLSVAPTEVEFDVDKNGRPSVSGLPDAVGGLDFNLSHTAGMTVIAVVADGRCGVDIEFRRELKNLNEMIHFSLTQAERKSLSSENDSISSRQYLDCWTRKEAFLKSTGQGLANPINEIDTTPLVRGLLKLDCRLEPPAGLECEDDCHVYDWSPNARYSGAVAIDHPIQTAQCRELLLHR